MILTFFPQTVKNLFFFSFKKCCKQPILTANNFFFYIFIPPKSDRGKCSIAEKKDGSNGTIVPFVTSDDLRRAHDTCWLLDVRSLTNSPDSVISSPKTKGSVIPHTEYTFLVWGVGQCSTGQNQYKYTDHSCGVGCEKGRGADLQCKA